MEQKYGRVLHLGIIVADLKKAVEIYNHSL